MKKSSVSVFVLASLFAASLSAATPAWVNLGPSPPAIEGAVASDTASGTIYIGTFGGGVLKSTDHGATFSAVNSGLGSLALTSLAMDPTNPDIVVVGTGGNGIFRTVNGGATWMATSDVGTLPTFVAVDPLNPQTYYAGYGVGNDAPIRKSVDGGATWTKSDSGMPPTTIWSIVPDPQNAGVVYAGSGNSGGFKSTDGGATWKSMSIQPVCWTVALDPSDTRNVYAGVNGDGVFKSTDAGATFTRVGSPSAGVVLAIAVDPADSQHLFAGTVSGGVEASTDGGVTWKKTNVQDGNILALSITDEGTIYAGTAFNGVLASAKDQRPPGKASDGPLKTKDAKSHHFVEVAAAQLNAINAQNVVGVTVDPLNSQHLLLGTNDGGLLGSTDGGAHWSDSGAGLVSRSPRKPVFNPLNPTEVWDGSFDGGGLYSSTDSGSHWTRHLFGSASIYVWTTVIDPHSGTIYAGSKGEGVWRSRDGGATFTRIDGGLIPQTRYITFDPSTPGKFFVASLNGLFRSLDDGATFTKVAPQLTVSVSIDPSNPNIVYAGTQALGVYKSVNGGATFAPANVGITFLRMSRTGSVIVDPSNPSTLYTGTEGGGVFRSIDGGATWTSFNAGLTELSVFGITLDAATNTLYVGGPGGVFKTGL